MSPRAPTSWSRSTEALALFLRGRTARTAGPTAAIVGTLLSAVNQGYLLAAGDADAGTRVAVNYLVPYTVASIGFLSARRIRVGDQRPAAPSNSLSEDHDHRGGDR